MFDAENELGFHPATDEVKRTYENLRTNFIELAELIERLCPDSRQKSLAFTNLQQAQMWAIASIAINETPLT